MSVSTRDLLTDLDHAFAQGTPDSRLAALWHTTDTLLAGRYSEEQIWTFGAIIDRLAEEIELRARAKLANLLSQSNNAPTQTIKKLAFDNSILVAGPVLANSPRIGENNLIEAARCKGQQHLLAIAQRKSLTEPVTDVLVTRGDQRVAHTVARNDGARFSNNGFWTLVKRSENDSILAECVGVRKDIPRHQFLQLIAKASDEVKQRLTSAIPIASDQVHHAVADAASAIHVKFGPASKEFYIAKRRVMELQKSGGLDEDQLCAFAKSEKLEESIVALSLLCDVPSDAAERALIDETPEMLLIFGRSAGLSWKTVQSLLVMRAGDKGVAKLDMDAASEQFSRLTMTTAKKVLSFYKARRGSTTM
jgi:uncharacterized protein (DUF2336 family)